MKKQNFKKLFFMIMVFLAASCSNDDSNKMISQRKLVIKKIVETKYYSGGDSRDEITDFTYEEEQLVSTKITTPSETYPKEYIIKYIYEGDKISQVIDYTDGVEISRDSYVYEGDFIKQILPNTGGIITDFTYVNGVIGSMLFRYIFNEQYIWIGKTDFVFTSGNLTDKTVESTSILSPVIKTKYRFDAKNNPGKHMNKYLRYLFSKEGFDLMSQNNVVYSQVQSDVVYPQTENYQIAYNEDDYPVEIKRTTGDGSIISKIKIEYQ